MDFAALRQGEGRMLLGDVLQYVAGRRHRFGGAMTCDMPRAQAVAEMRWVVCHRRSMCTHTKIWSLLPYGASDVQATIATRWLMREKILGVCCLLGARWFGGKSIVVGAVVRGLSKLVREIGRWIYLASAILRGGILAGSLSESVEHVLLTGGRPDVLRALRCAYGAPIGRFLSARSMAHNLFRAFTCNSVATVRELYLWGARARPSDYMGMEYFNIMNACKMHPALQKYYLKTLILS